MKTRLPTGIQRIVALITILTMLFGLVPVVEAQGVDSAKLERALYKAIAANPDGHFPVIVQMESGRDLAERRGNADRVEKDLKGLGGQKVGKLGIINGLSARLHGRAILALTRNPRVEAISTDYPVFLQATSAELLTEVVEATETELKSLPTIVSNAPAVWSTYANQGQGVTVAVLDSGVAASSDLPNALFGYSAYTTTTTLGDGGGHGTHVAGIVAGNGALSSGGYKGIAPQATVLSVKVLSDEGKASYSSIISAIQWMVANKKTHNIRVANLSFGSAATESYVYDPLIAAVEMAWFSGIVMVVSAGNSGPGASTVTVPGNDPYVITVGALDDALTAATLDDVVPEWSSRGPTAFDNVVKPDLVAPGRKAISLRVPGSYLDTLLTDRVVDEAYFRMSGTSMAAPVVAGTVALMLAQNPALTPNQVKYILKKTAQPVPGYDANTVGAGRVDALAAVQMAAQGTPPSIANQMKIPNDRFSKTIYPLAKGGPLKWRNATYKNISWENLTWENLSWDRTTWENLSWENISWESANWSNISWENLTWENISWESTTWDSTHWDTAGTDAEYVD